MERDDSINEAQRIALVDRLNKVTGEANSPLSEVLSYFPNKAELFVETQEHAQRVEGKTPDGFIHWTARHKNRGPGFEGSGWYGPGQLEHLGVHGFTAEGLVNLMGEVDNLRGEGWQGEFHYTPREAMVNRILEVAEKPIEQCSEWERIDKKALEVLKVVPEELELLKDYRESSQDAGVLKQRALELERQAKEFREQADIRIEQAKQRVESIYPRNIKTKDE